MAEDSVLHPSQVDSGVGVTHEIHVGRVDRDFDPTRRGGRGRNGRRVQSRHPIGSSLGIEEADELLPAVHVSLDRSALGRPARVGNLHHQRVRHAEALNRGRTDADQLGEAFRLQALAVGISVVRLPILEEKVEGNPERAAFFDRM